jgi:hypothetical protein
VKIDHTKHRLIERFPLQSITDFRANLLNR